MVTRDNQRRRDEPSETLGCLQSRHRTCNVLAPIQINSLCLAGFRDDASTNFARCNRILGCHLELPSWIATCGLCLLLYGFLIIGMRSRASETSSRLHVLAFGGSTPETRCTTSAPAFVGFPRWFFSLEGRRLPVVQHPHFQHHSVPSRNPNWCERCTELSPKKASPRSRGDLD